MANITWDQWYDDVIPQCNGVPANIAQQKIRAAAIQFFKGSRAWRYLALTPIDAVALQQRYPVSTLGAQGTVPADAVVAHIYNVIYQCEELDIVTPEFFKSLSCTWNTDTGCPTDATQFAEAEVALWPMPCNGAAGAIVLPDVALAPSQASAGLPPELFEKWRDEIALGAISLIHMIPKMPYSDVQLGMLQQQEFKGLMGGANARTASGRGPARLRGRTIYR